MHFRTLLLALILGVGTSACSSGSSTDSSRTESKELPIRYVIEVPNGRSTTTYYANDYTSIRTNCIEFTDIGPFSRGGEVQVCGNYTITNY